MLCPVELRAGWLPRPESNWHLQLRRLSLCPLNYEADKICGSVRRLSRNLCEGIPSELLRLLGPTRIDWALARCDESGPNEFSNQPVVFSSQPKRLAAPITRGPDFLQKPRTYDAATAIRLSQTHGPASSRTFSVTVLNSRHQSPPSHFYLVLRTRYADSKKKEGFTAAQSAD